MHPLVFRLKKENHREIARAQDIMVNSLYQVFGEAVFHGGTCIWRCYNGNRFSEDIDVYIPRDLNRVNDFFELLRQNGLVIERKKISEKSIFSTLRYNRTIVRFEAIFKKLSGSLRDYETTEGNFLVVHALTSDELIIEKANTYLNRQKVRDLYDVFFLLRGIKDYSKVRDSLIKLLKDFKTPKDEKDLNVIIIEGIVPTINEMLDYIRRKI